MRQVAEHAGVSQVTVTNVLRGRKGRTSEETRARVIQSVHELGYMPIAQLGSQRHHVETRVIGISIDQVVLGQDYSAMHIYRGLSKAAARHGFDLLMMLQPLPEWAPNIEEVQFLDRRNDGFIFVAPLKRRKVLQVLIDNHIPTVACFSEDVPDGVGWVTGNNKNFVRQALQHLVGYGHRRIAFLDGFQDNSDVRRRGEYFDEVAQELGLDEVKRFAAPCRPGLGSNSPALDSILAWGATAVICSNDGYALDLWSLADVRGLRVPQDLSIVGIDGCPEATAGGLTTVEFDFAEVASVAVDCWVALVQGGDWREQRRYVPGTLVERRSVAVPKSCD